MNSKRIHKIVFFLRINPKKGVFKIKYHEEIKDKKIKVSKNKFNPKNVFCVKNIAVKTTTPIYFKAQMKSTQKKSFV